MNTATPKLRYPHEYSLLDLCGRIHGSVSGSGDGIPTEEARRIHDWLDWRVGAGWEDPRPKYRRFDCAVRELCIAALLELSGELRHSK